MSSKMYLKWRTCVQCLILVWWWTNNATAQAPTYPQPLHSPDRLFFLQRNANRNTVVYDANLTESGNFVPTAPIKIYWITYEKGGIIEPLNYEQKILAYGVKTTEVAPNHYEFTLAAYDKLKFTLMLDMHKQPFVSTIINHKHLKINHIFIQAEGRLRPKVQYIMFYGLDLTTNETVEEKWTP